MSGKIRIANINNYLLENIENQNIKLNELLNEIEGAINARRKI